MTWERIPVDGWHGQAGHIERYQMAAQLIKDGDVVLDAACGIGYGAQIINDYTNAMYFGVDRSDGIAVEFLPFGWFRAVDLEVWEPEFQFDVGICFETLEHLQNPARWVDVLSRARREVIVSVPTVPTRHINEYHLHDFTVESVLDLFSEFRLRSVTAQPEELSHIFVFSTELSDN